MAFDCQKIKKRLLTYLFIYLTLKIYVLGSVHWLNIALAYPKIWHATQHARFRKRLGRKKWGLHVS